MGWTGSAWQWHNYEKAYVVLCGLCTLLVFTVSSIVGLDFCTAQIAGWHATIFPLYFVIGAVFCGFGMMLVLLIPLRKWCGLENIITKSHIDKVAKLTLVSGLIIDYIYLMEFSSPGIAAIPMNAGCSATAFSATLTWSWAGC
jgi:hypothetical protein